jgi:ubiquinone/menaquinone biosynthesis C-methylase UbiE
MIAQSDKISFFNEAGKNWNDNLSDQKTDYLNLFFSQVQLHGKPGSTMLDAGCGTGILFPFLRQYNVTAIDISPVMVEQARKHQLKHIKKIILADIYNMPFKDCCFDHAVMFAVFPHVEYPDIALKELYRVLEPGGTLSIIHTLPREILNNIHKEIGGAVAADFLPDDCSMQLSLESGGFHVLYKETIQGFSYIAKKQ